MATAPKKGVSIVIVLQTFILVEQDFLFGDCQTSI